MMVKPNQVINLSAIDLKGLSSRLKTEVPFCIDTTVTDGSFVKKKKKGLCLYKRNVNEL